jgi:cytochrome c
MRHLMIQLAVAAVALWSATAVALEPNAWRRLQFTRHHCAGCHAIGRVGASPLAEAPPFRNLHQRYAIDDLAESFAEGIRTGYPSMPEWRLDPGQIDDLIAYLKSLQTRGDGVP